MSEEQNEKLLEAMKELLNDLVEMQLKDPNWFGSFTGCEIDIDHVNIEWPNVAVSMKKLHDTLEEVGLKDD